MLNKYYFETGWNKKVELKKLDGVENFINTLPNIQYVGHGGTCIAFTSDDSKYNGLIIKVCIKNNLMLKTADTFLNYSKFLTMNKIKILKPDKILYEDDNFFIYTQPSCQQISNINDITMSKILHIIHSLLTNQIKITDIYCKNFGIYENDVYIYDYHDYDFFYSGDKYYISHIAHIFGLYYNISLFENMNFDVETFKKNEFGKGKLQPNICDMLEMLYNYDFDNAIQILENIIASIESNVKSKYKNYQYINIDGQGQLSLYKHTLNKFAIVKKLLNNIDYPFTLIDYGCCLGGIGCSVAQMYPKSQITLNNITQNELIVCNDIVKKCLLMNVVIENKNIVDDNNSYDICLYFAILHHILKNKTMDEIIQILMIQVKKYCVIELPFGDDALLKMVINDMAIDYKESFYYLETLEIFKEKIEKYFRVIDIVKIDYESDNLNRYALTLEKI